MITPITTPSPPASSKPTVVCQHAIQRYVHQYGVDSLLFTDLSGDLTLTFTGSTTVSLLPQSAYSGSYAFYSNKGDESDMTLTQTFDFTNESIPIEMTYQTWYDLETDYDYIYLEASTDGGENWQILNTPSCTNYDPSGNSYGCGYNGETGAGSRRLWTFHNLPGGKSLCGLNTSPMPPSMEKGCCWMTSASPQLVTQLILKRMMAAGKPKDSPE